MAIPHKSTNAPQPRVRRIELTRKDILDALDVPAHVLRQWLAKLSPYKEAATKERVPRKFGPRDVLFFYVVQWLTNDLSLGIDAVARCSKNLATALARPFSVTSPGYLFINVTSGSVELLRGNPPVDSGLIVILDPHVRKLQTFLDNDFQELLQQALPLGFVDVNR